VRSEGEGGGEGKSLPFCTKLGWIQRKECLSLFSARKEEKEEGGSDLSVLYDAHEVVDGGGGRKNLLELTMREGEVSECRFKAQKRKEESTS